MLLKFNVDGRKARGRNAKSLKDNDTNLCKGAIRLDGTCSNCKISQETCNLVECMSCSETYHADCLTSPLTTDSIQNLATDPSLWWFCRTCIVKGSDAAASSEDEDTPGFDEVNLMNFISEKLSSFKSEVLLNVNEIMDKHLEKIICDKNSSGVTNSNNILETVSLAIKDNLTNIVPPSPEHATIHHPTITWAQKCSTPADRLKLPVPTGVNYKQPDSKVNSCDNSIHDSDEVLVLSPPSEHKSVDTTLLNQVTKMVKREFNKAKVRTNKIDGNTSNGKVYIRFPDCV